MKPISKCLFPTWIIQIISAGLHLAGLSAAGGRLGILSSVSIKMADVSGAVLQLFSDIGDWIASRSNMQGLETLLVWPALKRFQSGRPLLTWRNGERLNSS